MKKLILSAIIGLVSSQSMANTVWCAVSAESLSKPGTYDRSLVLKEVVESELLITQDDYFISARVDQQNETIAISSGSISKGSLNSFAIGSMKGQVVLLDGNKKLITVCVVPK